MYVDPTIAFVNEHFGGDYTKALLAIARRGDIAVAYLDREWIEEWLDRPVRLSDREWDAIAPLLEDYDEFVSDTPDLNWDYIATTLKAAGFVSDDDDGEWSLPPDTTTS